MHPEVPIELLTDALVAALGNELVGLYAYGSAVSGGFDAGVSDIDLVAVTVHGVDTLDLEALDGAHRAFAASHPAWENRLEVVYVGVADLRDFRTSKADLAVISPGEAFHRSGPLRDWFQNWYLVRETGITLAGASVAEVVPAIATEDYLAAVASYARWLAMQDLERLPPGSLAYSVLSECRALYALRCRRPCTKQDAVAWLMAREPQNAPLLEAALACRLSRGVFGFEDEPTRKAAARFVRSIAAGVAAAGGQE